MQRYFKRISIGEPTKRVSRVDYKLVVHDAAGSVNVTDTMLQDGAQVTGHIPATREMLRKLRENALPAAPKHFNAILRGRQTLIIPNRGAYWSVVPETPVVTTAIDFSMLAKTAMPSGMRFSHFYRTRQLAVGGALATGDTLEVQASQRRIVYNGTPIANYVGSFLQCAAGNARFNFDLMAEGATIRPQPAARLLVEIQEWELATGGRRL